MKRTPNGRTPRAALTRIARLKWENGEMRDMLREEHVRFQQVVRERDHYKRMVGAMLDGLGEAMHDSWKDVPERERPAGVRMFLSAWGSAPELSPTETTGPKLVKGGAHAQA
jgi:hypothetical protein